jgi:hypothetical protein
MVWNKLKLVSLGHSSRISSHWGIAKLQKALGLVWELVE